MQIDWNAELSKLRTGKDIALSSLREEVRRLLPNLTVGQADFFSRLYPEGIDAMSQRRLENAINQLQRTIIKNNAKARAHKED